MTATARRPRFGWRVSTLLALAMLACSGASSPADLRVAAGDATQTSVVLWAHAAEGPVRFELSEDPGFAGIVCLETVALASPEIPVKVECGSLREGTRYWYRVRDALGSTGRGSFRTPHASGRTHGLRFGVTGDWRGELTPYVALRNAPDRDLDFFVLHGDTIYADFSSPRVPVAQARSLEEFRLKHAEVYDTRYGLNTLGDLRSSTVIYAGIDDHEVTDNFAGGAPAGSDGRFVSGVGDVFLSDTEMFRNGLQAFQEYNPVADEFYSGTEDPDNSGSPDPRMEGRRKLYRSRRFGDDAAFFLLDTRSFRSEPLPEVSDFRDPLEVAAFLDASFGVTDPTDTMGRTRTLLGARQLADLKADLLDAHVSGATWKFVLIPEPIQSLGPLAAPDRFEGYAMERDALLRWIAETGIVNVVFVAADFHGTLVNNLSYQIAPEIGPDAMHYEVPHAFEISTGPLAYDPPFGPNIIEIAAGSGALPAEDEALYGRLTAMESRDAFLETLIDTVLTLPPEEGGIGYDTMGLDESQAELLYGDYVRVHAYGWTEFEIDAESLRLTVTTYGVDPYTEADLLARPSSVTARQPRVIQRFVVAPVR